MPPLAKHAGTPDACLACQLAETPRERNQVIWEHAVSQFAEQSGVDTSMLHGGDLELMVRTWASAAVVGQLDAKLHGVLPVEVVSPDSPQGRYVLVGIWAAIGVVFFIICSGIWRFFT